MMEQQSKTFHSSELVIDFVHKCVSHNGKLDYFTPLELKMLASINNGAPHPVHRDVISKAVWGDRADSVDSSGFDKLYAREKFQYKLAELGLAIRNVERVGYVLERVVSTSVLAPDRDPFKQVEETAEPTDEGDLSESLHRRKPTPRNPNQTALGAAIIRALGDGAFAVVNQGFQPEEIALLLKEAGTAAQSKIDELAKQLNTTREAILGFLMILKEDEVPLERLTAKLAQIAQRHMEMLDRLEALNPEAAAGRDYIQQAREILVRASSTVDYDDADECLCKAEMAQEVAFEMVQELAREANDAAQRLRHSKAAIRAERGQLSLAKLDYLRALSHFEAAWAIVEGDDCPEQEFDYRVAAGFALVSYGEEKGHNDSLVRAIGIYRELRQSPFVIRGSLRWFIVHTSLAVALRVLGEREGDRSRLDEAVMAYRSVLSEIPREQDQLEWAMLETDLGIALFRLGERESGVGRLHEAIDAYNNALQEATRDRAPLQWALVMTNLGCTLLTLGEREAGTEHLEESIKIHRESLQEATRDRAPLLWALNQLNLGTALLRVGERECSSERLIESVTAFRAALEVATRERVPLQWAMTQNNLGNALRILGEADPNGNKWLEESVIAHREALNEYTQDRVPLEWALTQSNLGNVLGRLGERKLGTDHTLEAVAAYREALKEATRERAPLQWAMTQTNLGGALQQLSRREASSLPLKDAITAYRSALLEATPETSARMWASIQANLGLALLNLYMIENDPTHLEGARIATESALAVFDGDKIVLHDNPLRPRLAIIDYLTKQNFQ